MEWTHENRRHGAIEVHWRSESTVTAVGPQIKYNYSRRIISLTPETASTQAKFKSSVVVERGGGMTLGGQDEEALSFRPRNSLAIYEMV